jgi:hypothetical protein
MPNILDSENQHIYITSDEEIKEDDWGLSKLNEVILFGRSYNEKFYKKIILTTDQDLIEDGVQSIDDEFLEWFVKNPSCEYVEVNDSKVVKEHIFDGSNDGEIVWEKKIIIPQEEPKQKTRVFGTEDDKSFWSDKPKQKCEHIKEYGCIKDICTCNTGPKQDPTLENSKLALREYILANKEKVTEDLQEMREKSGTGRDETLEEAALSFLPRSEVEHDTDFITGFEFGAEWQAKRKYSEEDMLDFAEYCLKNVDAFSTLKDLFEQFKKK